MRDGQNRRKEERIVGKENRTCRGAAPSKEERYGDAVNSEFREIFQFDTLGRRPLTAAAFELQYTHTFALTHLWLAKDNVRQKVKQHREKTWRTAQMERATDPV